MELNFFFIDYQCKSFVDLITEGACTVPYSLHSFIFTGTLKKKKAEDRCCHSLVGKVFDYKTLYLGLVYNSNVCSPN